MGKSTIQNFLYPYAGFLRGCEGAGGGGRGGGGGGGGGGGWGWGSPPPPPPPHHHHHRALADFHFTTQVVKCWRGTTLICVVYLQTTPPCILETLVCPLPLKFDCKKKLAFGRDIVWVNKGHKLYYVWVHSGLVKAFTTHQPNMILRQNLHRLLSSSCRKALEAHGCKPWVANLSIIPRALGILTANIAYCIYNTTRICYWASSEWVQSSALYPW